MIYLNNKMLGRFRIEKFKGTQLEDGTVQEQVGSRQVCADWFDNLILDQGLNEIGTRTIDSAIIFCQVGSGSSTPSATNTSLDSLIAGTSSTQSSTQTFQTSEQPYYTARQVVKRFSEGAAEGILAEVGMGWSGSGTTLFSRALIEDGVGNPTTITVLSDEFLDVTYELRIYPNINDSMGMVTIGGIAYDYTARACEIDSSTHWGFSDDGTQSSSAFTRVYSGSIGDVFSSPSGTSDAATSSTNGTYSNNSLTGDSSYHWDLDDGNIGGVRSARLVVGWTTWQVEFSAQSDSSAIPKDNTSVLDLTIAHSWARGSI